MSANLRRRLEDSLSAFSTTARNRSLRRAELSYGAAFTAEWAFTVALSVVAFRDGGTTAVGIVAFARMAPAALLSPLGTALADRSRRDRVLMWSCLLRAAATGAAALLLQAGTAKVTIYALAALATVAFTVFRPAHNALQPALCRTPLELTSANVVRGLLDSISMLIGPLAAALLLNVSSAVAVFVFAAAMSLSSGMLLARLAYETPPRGLPQPLRRLVAETIAGFQGLARYRDARLLFTLALAQTLTRGFLNVFVVVIALTLLHMGGPGVGLLTAAVGAGAVSGSLGVAILVTGRRLAVVEGVGVMLWGLPLALSGAFPYEPAVLVLMGAIGVGNALVDVGLYTLTPRLLPERLLARVFGAFESLISLTVALGSLITPLVIDVLGIRGALVLLGLLAPTLAAFGWRRLRAIDASMAHRDEAVAVLRRVAMLRPLPMPAIDNLAVHVDQLHVDAGQDVFHQGDHGDRFYVIEDGEADVIGDERLIGTLGPGEGFGEIALLREVPRTTTVRARTPLELYALHRRYFAPAVSDYRSSGREAEAVIHDRLEAFDPGIG